MLKLRMKNCNTILTEKQQKYQHYSQVKLINTEYFTCEEILLFDQSRITEQAKFTYSPLDKAFQKQVKTIEEQGEKQIKALKKHGKQLVKSNNEKDSSTLSKQEKTKNLLIKEWKKYKI